MEEKRGISAAGEQYFRFLAEMGVTKHFGSYNVTRELIERCQIGAGQAVLDVGCGVGATPSLMAQEIGCRVTGVDITPPMLARARERAGRVGVARQIDLCAGDACALPFADHRFDAVICESVVVFVADKQRAVDEFARVTRPGGYVGLTEVTLLQPTDDTEFLAYMNRVAGCQGEMLSKEAWAAHLARAGLADVTARAYRLDMREEAKGRLRRYSLRDVLAALARLPRMWLRDPEAKAFLQQTAGGTKHLCTETFDYMGYGVYVGRVGEDSS
jgi:ubiquinone/menaquinone biosynthesis C-methylase UbiE